MCSSLSHEEDPLIHTGRGVFIQPHAQIGFPLRLKQIVEHAHFRFVIRAALYFEGAVVRELTVGRLAVPQAVEPRPQALRFLDTEFHRDTSLSQVGLAGIAARRSYARRGIRKTHAAGW